MSFVFRVHAYIHKKMFHNSTLPDPADVGVSTTLWLNLNTSKCRIETFTRGGRYTPSTAPGEWTRP